MAVHMPIPQSSSGKQRALCFVVDADFVYLAELAKFLRTLGADTLEFIDSGRLGESIENLNPNIVFLNLTAANPSDCVRALFVLKESKFSGFVQLMGQCDLSLLESFRKVASEIALKTLPPLPKPIDLQVVGRIANEQKLISCAASTVELSLKKALASNCVEFRYQPQVELGTKVIVGAETLARVLHPRHGLILPENFLSGSRDEDLAELGMRSLVSALKTSAKLFHEGANLTIAINVSIETLSRLPVAQLVQRLRPQDNRWPGLIFEIAETQVLNKMAALKRKFAELQNNGISLAIDNCGRGNSSFGVLRQLPFSAIKVDRSFVSGCAHDADQANICKSIIQFSHNFGTKAAAVGIETDADARKVENLGCDLGQGHQLGKPLS